MMEMKPYSALSLISQFSAIFVIQFSLIKVKKSSRSKWLGWHEEDSVEKNSSVNKDEKLIGKNW